MSYECFDWRSTATVPNVHLNFIHYQNKTPSQCADLCTANSKCKVYNVEDLGADYADRGYAYRYECKLYEQGSETMGVSSSCVKRDPKDCTVSEWSSWSNCELSPDRTTCMKTRTRSTLTPAVYGGTCNSPLIESEFCNMNACSTETETDTDTETNTALPSKSPQKSQSRLTSNEQKKDFPEIPAWAWGVIVIVCLACLGVLWWYSKSNSNSNE